MTRSCFSNTRNWSWDCMAEESLHMQWGLYICTPSKLRACIRALHWPVLTRFINAILLLLLLLLLFLFLLLLPWPKPACTYCKSEPSVYLVTTIISPNLDKIISYSVHTLPNVFTPRKLFRFFTRRKLWFGGNFYLRQPYKFPPVSLTCRNILCSCVLPRISNTFQNLYYCTSHKIW